MGMNGYMSYLGDYEICKKSEPINTTKLMTTVCDKKKAE